MYIREALPLSGKRSKKVRLITDEGTSFILYKREASRYGLDADMEISQDQWEHLMQEVFIPRARSRAMHLLERQDRTVSNLRQKLRDSGYPDEAIASAVEYVESYHYVDDDRYARSYVRYHQSGKSRRRIRMDLIKKGITDEVIQEALDAEYTVSEEDMIRAAIQKRHLDPATSDLRERQRIYRFLLGRGFSYEDIQHAIG